MKPAEATHEQNLLLFNRLFKKLSSRYHDTRVMFAQRGNYIMDVDMTTADIVVGRDKLERRYFAMQIATYNSELNERRPGWVCLWEKKVKAEVEVTMTVRTVGEGDLQHMLDEAKVYTALRKFELILEHFVQPPTRKK